MTFSDKSTTLLDETMVYHQELHDFLNSRSVATGRPHDLEAFLKRLNDPELQDEVGCLLRSILFREEGEIATSRLAALLLDVVCGPEAVQSSLDSVHVQRLSAFVQLATQGVSSFQTHAFAMEDLAEEQMLQSKPEVEPEFSASPAPDLRLEPFRKPILPVATTSLFPKKATCLLAVLQRFYWLPAGAASLLAVVLCVYLPRATEQQPSPAAQQGLPAVNPFPTAKKPPVLTTYRHPVPYTGAPHRPRRISPARTKLPMPVASASPALYAAPPRATPPGEVLLASSGLVASHLLYAPAPEYPALARMQHTEGTVLLRLLIDRAGTVASTQILRGSAPFAAAAVQAVRRWRYTPFVSDGTARVGTLVTITFRLPL